MLRLGLLVGIVAWASACDTSEPFDVTPLTGVYAGSRTVDVLAAEPETQSATITVSANQVAGTARFALATDGESPVVVNGTVAESGTITASNTTETSRLPIEFVIDPSGTVRGNYTRLGDEPGTSATGDVEGALTPDAFLLTLVEPEEGGVRIEYRTFR